VVEDEQHALQECHLAREVRKRILVRVRFLTSRKKTPSSAPVLDREGERSSQRRHQAELLFAKDY